MNAYPHSNPVGLADADVATLHQRLMIAFASAGINDPQALVRAWNLRYERMDGKKLHRQTAHKWFSPNIKTLDPETLFRLADLTKFSARWILRREGPPGKWLPADPDRLAIMEIFDALSNDSRDAWIRIGTQLVPPNKKLGEVVFTERGKKTV